MRKLSPEDREFVLGPPDYVFLENISLSHSHWKNKLSVWGCQCRKRADALESLLNCYKRTRHVELNYVFSLHICS